MSLTFIDLNRRHWKSQAVKYGMSPDASWGDRHMIALEVEEIGRYLKRGMRVLDAGCGNGYSALLQHQKRRLGHLTGIDSCEKFVALAKKARKKSRFREKTAFEIGDIRHLPFAARSFDAVYTTRVLINLSGWADQKRAILECLRVTKRGGTVLISEAFMEPYRRLNKLRKLAGLAPLPIHSFNRYLEKNRLEKFLASLNVKFRAVDFSSVYYFGTRFLRELVTDADRFPGYSNPINPVFYDLERKLSGGGFGIQQLYVIQA